MFVLENLTKRYAGHAAVDDVSLALEPGTTTALIGPSGCGKSTLLRLMMALIPATSGRVSFEGEELSARTARALRPRMGYVIQHGGLFPHMTARRNASLMAKQLGAGAGWTKDRIDGRLTELADLTHLPQTMLGRYPAELSGGQRQRIALMRALFLDPDALLLDEPLGALDPLIRAELQTDLRDIFQRLGKTVVIVTHDLAEAAFLADRIVLMRKGRVVQDAPFETLAARPADDFVRAFIQAQAERVAALAGIHAGAAEGSGEAA